jgi:hypothetical protein
LHLAIIGTADGQAATSRGKEARGDASRARSLSWRRHSGPLELVCHAVSSILGVVSLCFQGLVVEEDEFDYYDEAFECSGWCFSATRGLPA